MNEIGTHYLNHRNYVPRAAANRAPKEIPNPQYALSEMVSLASKNANEVF